MKKLILNLTFIVNIVLLCPILSSASDNNQTSFLKNVKAGQAKEIIIKNIDNPNFIILDMRTPNEYNKGHLKNAQLINFYDKDVIRQLNKLDKTKTYLVYCGIGYRSKITSNKMEKMGFKKILVLTFKPAVENAWEEDLMLHKDFEDWQFYSKNNDLEKQRIDKSKPLVLFGSFQDFLGKNSAGGIKEKNKWVHNTKWDVIIFDEYHWGAWREGAKDLFDKEEDTSKETDTIAKLAFEEGVEEAEKLIPIKTNHYLYLSGTPFRAIETGEFIEDQIFNWTYSDEQNAKENWKSKKELNPYLSLPKMIMMTYQMPDSIKHIAQCGEFDEFDLNVFFSI